MQITHAILNWRCSSYFAAFAVSLRHLLQHRCHACCLNSGFRKSSLFCKKNCNSSNISFHSARITIKSKSKTEIFDQLQEIIQGKHWATLLTSPANIPEAKWWQNDWMRIPLNMGARLFDQTLLSYQNHGRLSRWRKWRTSDVGEAKEGLENELRRRWSNGRVGEWAVT